MRRAAIILATILFTGILPFSSLSLATSDEEIDHAADEMRAAFRCSKYAGMFNDLNEAHRLFQIGLNAGRDFVEGLKSHINDPTTEYMRGGYQRTFWSVHFGKTRRQRQTMKL